MIIRATLVGILQGKIFNTLGINLSFLLDSIHCAELFLGHKALSFFKEIESLVVYCRQYLCMKFRDFLSYRGLEI